MFALLRVLPSLTGLSAGYVGARNNIERLGQNTKHINEATTSIVVSFAFISLSTYMLSSNNGYGLLNIAAEMFGAAAFGTCIGAIDATQNQRASCDIILS